MRHKGQRSKWRNTKLSLETRVHPAKMNESEDDDDVSGVGVGFRISSKPHAIFM